MKLGPRAERAAMEAAESIGELVTMAVQHGATRAETTRLIEQFLQTALAAGVPQSILAGWRAEFTRAIADARQSGSISIRRH